jgi:ATP-dependent DNA helicase RecQ
VESDYQQIGRAGRDGLESQTLLLFGAQDLLMQKGFIDELPEGEYKRHAYAKLDALWRLAGGEHCRHRAIAAYFGEELEACGDRCDNCLAGDREQEEITREARMFLSAVYRSGQRFGVGYLVDLLRGSRDRRILERGHDRLSVHGIGEERDRATWSVVADRLLELGAVELNEYKGLALTAEGVEILRGGRKVTIRRDRLEVKSAASKRRAVDDEEPFDRELFDRLRELRQEIASEQGVPPYVVFSDKTLRELSRHRPADREAMLAIHGIGEVKFERYGERFLELLEEL